MEQELDEKLAQWAGFTKADIKKHYYFEIGGERKAKWIEPERDWHFKLPDFTHSLDACFEWLVPKLQEMGLMLTINMLGVISRRWDARLHRGYFPNKTICLEEAETPALALCLAIEKLIDGGKDDRQ